MKKEVSIIFPCLNEAETLRACLKNTKQIMQKSKYKDDYEIVVCDNGSTDESAEICKKQHVKVLREERRGYGNALMIGITELSSKYIVMLDCDGTYEIADIPKIIDELENGNDFVIGNRFKGKIESGAMTLSHRIGSSFLTKYANLLFHTKSHDFHCGLRGFDRQKMLDCDLNAPGFEFASEMVIKAKLNKLKIKEFPTDYHKAGRSHKPHLRTIRDGFRHLHLINKTKFETSKPVRYVTTFALSILAIFAFSFFGTLIPRSAIQDNVITSVREINSSFLNTPESEDATKKSPYARFEKYGDIRNYAMAYTIDESKPLTSIIEMNYPASCDSYATCGVVLKNNFDEAIISYSRYWQGQTFLVRYTLPFISAGTLVFILTVIFAALFIYVFYKLFKEDKILAIIFVISALMINIPFTTRSLEFIPMMFIMLIASLLVLHSRKHGSKNLDIIFLVMGVVTCYFDFLTAETLSLTVPLFIYTYLEIKTNGKASVKNIIKMSILWLVGYAGAFVVKWFIDYLHFGDEFFEGDMNYLVHHTMNGEVRHAFIGTFTRNLIPILPFALLPNGTYALIGIILICLIYCAAEKREYLILYSICLVPLARYFVVRAHSYSLYFFTYRALMPLMMMTVFMIIIMIKNTLGFGGRETCDKMKKREKDGRKSRKH